MEGAARGCRQPQASTSIPTFSCGSNYGCWTTHALAGPANSPLEATSLLGFALASHSGKSKTWLHHRTWLLTFRLKILHPSASCKAETSISRLLVKSSTDRFSARWRFSGRIYYFLRRRPILPRRLQSFPQFCLFGFRAQSVGVTASSRWRRLRRRESCWSWERLL